MNLFRKRESKIDLFLDFTDQIRRKDNTKMARICSALGYFFFFIPSIMLDENQFGQFHANQSLLNLALFVLGGVMIGLGVASMAIICIALVLELFCLFNTVRGVVLSLQGKAKGIPLIGWITFVAYRLPGQ